MVFMKTNDLSNICIVFELLGEGRFGPVYKGRRLSDGSLVAIKCYSFSRCNYESSLSFEDTVIDKAEYLGLIKVNVLTKYDVIQITNSPIPKFFVITDLYEMTLESFIPFLRKILPEYKKFYYKDDIYDKVKNLQEFNYQSEEQYILEAWLQFIAIQVMNGLDFLQKDSKSILVKLQPKNIAIIQNGDIKICDYTFNNSKSFSKKEMPFFSPSKNLTKKPDKISLYEFGLTLIQISMSPELKIPRSNVLIRETFEHEICSEIKIQMTKNLTECDYWSDDMKDFILNFCLDVNSVETSHKWLHLPDYLMAQSQINNLLKNFQDYKPQTMMKKKMLTENSECKQTDIQFKTCAQVDRHHIICSCIFQDNFILFVQDDFTLYIVDKYNLMKSKPKLLCKDCDFIQMEALNRFSKIIALTRHSFIKEINLKDVIFNYHEIETRSESENQLIMEGKNLIEDVNKQKKFKRIYTTEGLSAYIGGLGNTVLIIYKYDALSRLWINFAKIKMTENTDIISSFNLVVDESEITRDDSVKCNVLFVTKEGILTLKVFDVTNKYETIQVTIDSIAKYFEQTIDDSNLKINLKNIQYDVDVVNKQEMILNEEFDLRKNDNQNSNRDEDFVLGEFYSPKTERMLSLIPLHPQYKSKYATVMCASDSILVEPNYIAVFEIGGKTKVESYMNFIREINIGGHKEMMFFGGGIGHAVSRDVHGKIEFHCAIENTNKNHITHENYKLMKVQYEDNTNGLFHAKKLISIDSSKDDISNWVSELVLVNIPEIMFNSSI